MKKVNRKTSIAGRLHRSYAMIFAIVIGIISILLITIFYSVNELKHFYSGPYQAVQLTLELSEKVERVEKNILKSVILHNETSEEYINEVMVLFDDIDTKMQELKNYTNGNKSRYIQLESLLSEGLELKSHIHTAVLGGNYEQALQIYNNQLNMLFQEAVKTLDTMRVDALKTSHMFFERSNRVSLAVGSGIVFLLLLGWYVTKQIAKKALKQIVEPIRILEEETKKLAAGHLEIHVNYREHDEIGSLAECMNQMGSMLEEMIGDIGEVTKSMVANDLTVTIEKEYIGDFSEIKIYLMKLIESFRNILGEIGASSTEMTKGADQLATISQTMAAEAVEQAKSIGEMIASLQKVISRIQWSIDASKQTQNQVYLCDTISKKGLDEMQEMMEALGYIHSHSMQIQKVMKTMQDFAKRTKLLALNASIESARCGEAGSGFAVVAEEIRILADQSAESALEVNQFLARAMEASMNGNKIAARTNQSFKELEQCIEEVKELVETTTTKLLKEEKRITSVSEGLDTISVSTEKGSATAQETLAASEVLQNRANELHELVTRFKIN